MSQDTLNKLIGTILVIVIVAAYTIMAIAHVSVPDFVAGISGVVVGFIVHAFGVNNGSNAAINGVKSGQLSEKSTP